MCESGCVNPIFSKRFGHVKKNNLMRYHEIYYFRNNKRIFLMKKTICKDIQVTIRRKREVKDM